MDDEKSQKRLSILDIETSFHMHYTANCVTKWKMENGKWKGYTLGPGRPPAQKKTNINLGDHVIPTKDIFDNEPQMGDAHNAHMSSNV